MFVSKYTDEQLYGPAVSVHMGHTIRFARISYSCPALKLFGFAYEENLRRAIARKVRAEEKKQQKRLATV